MVKHLLFNQDARDKLLNGIEIVYRAVSSSLGPRGSNTAIAREYGHALVCQDGVTISREVSPLEDPFANIGAELILQASERTNSEVGDGTTLACCICYAIAKETWKNVAAGANAMILRRGINKAVEKVVEKLAEVSKPIKTDEEVEQIASISAQNPEIGGLIAGAIKKLGKDCVITVEESKGTSMSVEYKEGMEFDKGWVSPHFVTNPELMEAKLENPYILITDKTISNIHEFVPFINDNFAANPDKENNALLIIAEKVDGDALPTLIANKVRGGLQVVVVQCPGHGDKQTDMLEDIAVLTGGTFISKNGGTAWKDVTLKELGRSHGVTVTKDSTLIAGGTNNEQNLTKRIKLLKTQLDNPDLSAFDKESIQERLAKLTSGIAVVNVGANSDVELRELKERVIDAISATKAAIDEGIVPGGETTLYRIADELIPEKSNLLEMEVKNDEEFVGWRIVESALRFPFERLMENSGYNPGKMMAKLEENKELKNVGIDVIDGELKDLVNHGIIDPARVLRCALQNAASAAIILTTTQVLIINKEDNAKDTKDM